MFIGGEGDDIGVASGRYNTLFGGTGADQLWAFGERAYIAGNEGEWGTCDNFLEPLEMSHAHCSR
jgi:hypothetical protein